MDFAVAKQSRNGYVRPDALKEDPLMIVRAGGVEAAEAYLNIAIDRQNLKSIGHWHPFNKIDPDQPQARVLLLTGKQRDVGAEDEDLLGFQTDSGIQGSSSLINIARYVAVAPGDVSTSVRYLNFGADAIR